MKNLFLQCSVLFLLCFNFVAAQQNYSLLINNKTIELPENKGKLKSSCNAKKQHVFNDIVHVYVQFYTLPSDQEKKIFESKGVKFLSYIPNNTYVCAINKNLLKAVADKSIRSVVYIADENKINPVLAAAELPAWALKPNNQIDLVVTYYEDLDHAAVKAAFEKNKFYIISESAAMHHFQIRVKTDAIKTLATLPFVAYLDPERAPAIPENEVERTNHRSYAIDNNLIGSNGLHYDGAGVSVAIGDDGIIGPHIDYTGRTNQTAVTSNGGDHGDHVTGILGGAGNLDPKTKGMAPACSLYIYDPYENISLLPTHYGQYGIRITSLSYGQSCNGGYTTDANQIDAMMRSYPAAISVFSAGNSGTSNCNYKGTSITGWGNITGGMKTGKNVIAVANVLNTDSIASSSSRGPATDGRIKPDISAVGTNVYSTVSTNVYTNNTGTSMSCPAISGVLAQLYQAFRANNNGADPLGALMKGILLNTADDMGNPGPDYKFGFGRVNAIRALRVIEKKAYSEWSVSNNDSVTINLTIPTNVKKVKIMLYYADKEASSGASKAIVNDLNMTVKDAGGIVYNPWVLDPTPTLAALSSWATRKVDSLNNMEQVTIDNPTAGGATIKVKGFQVPFGPQKFYIIYDFIYDSLQLVYPLGNDRWSPGVSETIRWDSWNTTDLITLQTSLDNVSWNTISSSIPAKNRLNSYTPAVNANGKLWIKIKQGTNESVTSQFINVSVIPTNLKIDWICSGSCKISWTAVSGASSYNIYRLGTKNMDSVGNTTNNYYVFTGIDSTQDDWFSVNTLVNNNTVSGERALAIKKTKLNKLNCTNTVIANFASSRNNVCTNDTVSFIPTTTPPTGLNYFWRFTGGIPASSTLSNPIVRYATPGTYPVSLAVSTTLGGTSILKNNYITIVGTVTNAGNDQSICLGDTAILSGVGGVSFTWTFNKAILANTAVTKIAPSATSMYVLSSINSQGCTSFDSIMIFVNSLPAKPNISGTPTTLSTDSVATTYQWFKDGVLIPAANSLSYTPTSFGKYKVRVGNNKSCYSFSDELTFIPVGMNRNEISNKVTLFPNPNYGSFTITSVAPVSKVVIYDLLGKEVTSLFSRINLTNNKIEFYNIDASKGLYLVTVNNEDIITTLKFVIE